MMRAILALGCLLILVVGSVPVFGQNGNLVVFSQTSEPFTIAVGPQTSMQTPSMYVRVTDVPSGVHEVLISFANPGLRPLRNRVEVQGGRELTLAIARQGTETKLVFVNEYSLVTMYNPKGAIVELPYGASAIPAPDAGLPVPSAERMPGREDVGVVTGGLPDDVPSAEGPGDAPVVKPAPVKPAPSKPSPKPSEPVAKPSPQPAVPAPAVVSSSSPDAAGTNCTAVDGRTFKTWVGRLKTERLSTTRLEAAKELTREHCLNAAQVLEVMGLFAFDADKLGFASLARLADPENAFTIREGFTFQSTMEAWDQRVK